MKLQKYQINVKMYLPNPPFGSKIPPYLNKHLALTAKVTEHYSLIDLDVKPEWEILGEFVGSYPSGQRHGMLNVRCGGCGEESVVNKSSVLRGKSHECKKCSAQRRGLKRRKSSLVGLLTRQYYHAIRAGAKERKLPFKVTQQELWHLFVSQGAKCALTGRDINLSTKLNGKDIDWTAFNASLDRIDSSVGYVEGNLQWVHRNINLMKMNLTDEELVQNCRDVVVHADKQQLGTK